MRFSVTFILLLCIFVCGFNFQTDLQPNDIPDPMYVSISIKLHACMIISIYLS